MKIFVSIISHGHQREIIEGGLLAALNGVNVVLRENKPSVCRQIESLPMYFHNLRCNGFGTNHNKNFEILNLADEDWFVICNPDIFTDVERIYDLVNRADSDGEKIATPYLLNGHIQKFDHNVRRRPTLINLAQAFLKLGGTSRYSDDDLHDMRYPDWCSGALMAIKAGTFRELNGFDESYFMYMEDVDICMRAARKGFKIRFYSDIIMVHNAARASGNIFSRSFVQHLTSTVRYFWKHFWD